MGYTNKAADWQVCGIAQVGVVVGVGAGLYLFEFRSKAANTQAIFSFLSVGIGLGGSLGGGVGPSPSDVVFNRRPELYSSIKCLRPFSLEDLNHSFAEMKTLSITAAYGYSNVLISAGYFTRLFYEQDASGWGTGVGIVGAKLEGVWTGWSMREYPQG